MAQIDNIVAFPDPNSKGSTVRGLLNQVIDWVNPLKTNVTENADDNLFLGVDAGINNDVTGVGDEGTKNLFIGSGAGKGNTKGYSTVAIGTDALYQSTIGEDNTAVGAKSQYANAKGGRCTSIGSESMLEHIKGAYNTVGGFEAMMEDEFGTRNTFFGYKAGRAGKILYESTGIGYKSLENANPRGAANTDYTDNGDGTVNVYSTVLPVAGETTLIIGTGNQVNHEYTDEYDGAILVDSVGVGYFVITHAYIDPATLDNLGRWKGQFDCRWNTALGFASGDNITTGYGNLCVGHSTDVDDPEGHLQINIGNVMGGSGIGSRLWMSTKGTFRYAPLAAAPSLVPVAGETYFNDTDKHFYGYNGTGWVQLDN